MGQKLAGLVFYYLCSFQLEITVTSLSAFVILKIFIEKMVPVLYGDLEYLDKSGIATLFKKLLDFS